MELLEFCDKWITLFSVEEVPAYLLVHEEFAQECSSFGWEMDCGKAFSEKYSCNAERALPFVEQETDVALIGSALFSYWRYFNHWAYSSAEILDHRDWFVAVLNRIKTLSK